VPSTGEGVGNVNLAERNDEQGFTDAPFSDVRTKDWFITLIRGTFRHLDRELKATL
jgi:hypothetical protein